MAVLSVKLLNKVIDNISVHYMGDETIIKTGLLQIDQNFLTWMVEVSEEMQNSMQVLSFNETIKHRIMFFRTLSKYALIQEKNYASFFS